MRIPNGGIAGYETAPNPAYAMTGCAWLPIGFDAAMVSPRHETLETRRYGMEIRGAVKTNWHYTSIAAMELHAAHRNVEVKNAEFLLMYDGPR